MSARRRSLADTPNAIPPGSTEKRLAALARRLGGNTAPVETIGNKVILPTISRWGDCDGQLDLLEEIKAVESEPTA